jgi:hypothetical protein
MWPRHPRPLHKPQAGSPSRPAAPSFDGRSLNYVRWWYSGRMDALDQAADDACQLGIADPPELTEVGMNLGDALYRLDLARCSEAADLAPEYPAHIWGDVVPTSPTVCWSVRADTADTLPSIVAELRRAR